MAAVEGGQGAVAGDLPYLPGAVLPIRIAGEEDAVRGDGQVVGLVHLRLVHEERDLLRLGIDPQDVMVHVVGHEHRSRVVEADAVPYAVAGKRDKHLASPLRRDAADGPLPGEVHGIDETIRIAGGAFDAGSEFAFLGERRGDEKLFRVVGERRKARNDDEDGGGGAKHGDSPVASAYR